MRGRLQHCASQQPFLDKMDLINRSGFVGAQQSRPHTCRPSPASSAPRPTAAMLPSAAKHMGAAASASSAPALTACAAHGAQAAPAASAPAPDAAGSPGAGARQRSSRSSPAPARDCTITAVPAAHLKGLAMRVAAAACRVQSWSALPACKGAGGARAASSELFTPNANLCDATACAPLALLQAPGCAMLPPDAAPGMARMHSAHLRALGRTAPAARGNPAAGPARPPPGTPAASWRRLAAHAQRQALCGY